MKRYKGYPYKTVGSTAIIYTDKLHYILGIASPALCSLYSDKVNELQETKRKTIPYSCNIKKNIKYKKIYCSEECCNKTIEYKYAKKTIINYIKKIINKIKGNYIYESNNKEKRSGKK